MSATTIVGKAAAEILIRYMGEEGKVAILTGVPGALKIRGTDKRIQRCSKGLSRNRDSNYCGLLQTILIKECR